MKLPLEKRFVAFAVEVAAQAPAKQGKYRYFAQIPWELVNRLRGFLDENNIDWRRCHPKHAKQNKRAK